jgi:hypothetical protein
LELQPQLQLQSLLIVKHCNNSCNCNTIEISSLITIFSIHYHKIQNSQLQWAPSAAPCGSGLGGSVPSAITPAGAKGWGERRRWRRRRFTVEDGSRIGGSHDVVRVHRSGSIVGHIEGGDNAEGRGTFETIMGEHGQGVVRWYLVETVPQI